MLLKRVLLTIENSYKKKRALQTFVENPFFPMFGRNAISFHREGIFLFCKKHVDQKIFDFNCVKFHNDAEKFIFGEIDAAGPTVSWIVVINVLGYGKQRDFSVSVCSLVTLGHHTS